jgi:hypothetical protein
MIEREKFSKAVEYEIYLSGGHVFYTGGFDEGIPSVMRSIEHFHTIAATTDPYDTTPGEWPEVQFNINHITAVVDIRNQI